MTHSLSTPIVVGIDGSPESLRAVDWATAEAMATRHPLKIVHVFAWPMTSVPAEAYQHDRLSQDVRAAAQGRVDAAIAHARALAPELELSGTLVAGAPVPELVRASDDAHLLVVASRGHGGFVGLLVGSVGVGVAAHARCPVVVVRPSAEEAGPDAGRVVVGVDGSPHGELALRFAFDAAARRGVGLTVVHTWTEPAPLGPGDVLPPVYDIDLVIQEETRVLAELIAGWREKYPDTDIRQVVEHARASHTLVERSAGAELLVVGSRGRGGLRGLLLGSVSQAAIHHAMCPVVVVRTLGEGADER